MEQIVESLKRIGEHSIAMELEERHEDQHISKLELELKAMKVKMCSPSDQLDQPQREMEMLQEKSKDGIGISQKQSEEVLYLVIMMHEV